MGIEYGERPVRATERFVVAASCDRCGGNAYRPTVTDGTVACSIQRLKRPGERGNWPEPDTPLVLCHDCADALARWVRGAEGPLERGEQVYLGSTKHVGTVVRRVGRGVQVFVGEDSENMDAFDSDVYPEDMLTRVEPKSGVRVIEGSLRENAERRDPDAATPEEEEAIKLARSMGQIDLPDGLRLAMRLSVKDATLHDLRTLGARAFVLARRRSPARARVEEPLEAEVATSGGPPDSCPKCAGIVPAPDCDYCGSTGRDPNQSRSTVPRGTPWG